MNCSLTRFPALFLVLLLALIGCKKSESGAGTGSSAKTQNPRIAYVCNGVASFWTIAKVGAEKAGADLNANVSVHMPAEGISDQKRIIEDLITRGVEGLAVSPIDPANQIDLLNKAAKQTLLITHDSDAPQSDRLLYIGMDNYTAGRLCGALVKEALPNGGTVMIYIGRLEQDNSKRRRQGVIDEILDRPNNPANFDVPGTVLKNGKYTILGTLTDQFDRVKGKANAEDTLSKHPDIGCMVGLFGYNPPLLLEALKQAGKLNQVKVVAFDEDDATLQGIKDGTVHGTVVQNPYMYGYKSVEVLLALRKGDKAATPASKFIDIPARQIRKDTVDAFWNDLKAKLGKGG
ncbi:MAG: sugar ABC transporter substrate-binding protein [Pedosphaera sp.]|nr:sugar ABC transporter substrate-binding protein [Pedosphaera sp.]